MTRRTILLGTFAYLLLTFVVFPFVIGIQMTTFLSDDAFYSGAAQGLLNHGFFSLDGVHPTFYREPGQSVLLALSYAMFGIENPYGIFLIHGLLLYISTFYFCRVLARETSARTAGIAFFLILTSGSVLHTVFSAYRECLTLSLFMIFSGLAFSFAKKPTALKTVGLGALFACAILTYYSFIYLPIAIALLWLLERRPVRHVVLFLIVTYALTSVWSFRNYVRLGHFDVIDQRRANVAIYVRGEQAEKVRGWEPALCLWAEYVSRSWEGRSPVCSFNAVMNTRWPEGPQDGVDTSAEGKQGRAKILAHPVSYLWFSAWEVIELHLPYVGGGWSTRYNVYALLTQLLLFIGFAPGLLSLRDPRFRLFVLFIAYNTALFILTDATPRYLLPVFFAYAVIAAVGYDRSLKRFSRP